MTQVTIKQEFRWDSPFILLSKKRTFVVKLEKDTEAGCNSTIFRIFALNEK